MSDEALITSSSTGLIPVEERSPKNGKLTFSLACLGGFLGLHRFYLGRWWTGLLMLLTLGGAFVWWVVDVLMILSGRFKDGQGRVLGPPRHLKDDLGDHQRLEPPQRPSQ